MRILAFLVLGIGISLAGGGVYYVSEFLKQQQAGPVTTEYVTVLVASQPLAKGDLLRAEQLRYISLPRPAVPKGAYSSMTALFGDLGDRKRFVARSFEPGEPILEGKLSNSNRNGGIGPGMRLVSIPVNSVSIVSGFVTPGDRVDILLTRDQQGKLTNSVILQDIDVFAVDQRSDSESATPRVGRTVTVEVNVVQAQKLALAQQIGRLSLTLRGSDTTDDSGAKAPVTIDDLNDLNAPEAVTRKFIWIRREGVLEKVWLE